MEIETAVIRQFLRERFDDEELDALCFDYFADVQHDFTLGMAKGQKIQLLLDHCRRQNRLPDLLAALERERPDLYKAHFGEAVIVHKTAVHPKPHPRNPRQIFISHANRDADLAHGLAQDLRAHGWQVWIAPDSIQPGEKWVEAIGRGLEESGVFVLVVTEDAVASRWVKHEANLAIQLETKGKMRFFPLLVELAETPLMWQAYQFLTFTADDDSGLKELLARLEDRPVQSKTGDFPQKPDEAPTVEANGTAAGQQPGILDRLGLLPLWAVGVLLVVVVLAIWGVVAQFNGSTDLEETREPLATPVANLPEGLWPFIEIAPRGTIAMNQAVTGRLASGDEVVDTWVVSEVNGRSRIDITLESEGIGILRLYDPSSQTWNDYMNGGEHTSSSSGLSLQIHNAVFHEGSQYLIAVSDANGQPANYRLTVEPVEPMIIGPATNTPTATPTPTAVPLPTNTPAPVIIEIPVEISGEIFEISASYVLDPPSNNLTFTFLNSSQKEPVNVIVEKANGGGITTSGDMDRGDEKMVTTLLSSELSGVRIKIFRWAPGFLGALGSGGGEAFLTLPTTGDVEITIEVVD